MRFMGSVLIAVVLLSLPGTAMASAQDQANHLSGEIMSPFCPGVTLHECPSDEAIELRDRIARWFEHGLTRGQILQQLEDEYGDSIRATPSPDGAGLAAWLLPGLALIAGLGLATWLLIRWKGAGEPTPTKEIPAAERQRLDEELAGLRAGR